MQKSKLADKLDIVLRAEIIALMNDLTDDGLIPFFRVLKKFEPQPSVKTGDQSRVINHFNLGTLAGLSCPTSINSFYESARWLCRAHQQGNTPASMQAEKGQLQSGLESLNFPQEKQDRLQELAATGHNIAMDTGQEQMATWYRPRQFTLRDALDSQHFIKNLFDTTGGDAKKAASHFGFWRSIFTGINNPEFKSAKVWLKFWHEKTGTDYFTLLSEQVSLEMESTAHTALHAPRVRQLQEQIASHDSFINDYNRATSNYQRGLDAIRRPDTSIIDYMIAVFNREDITQELVSIYAEDTQKTGHMELIADLVRMAKDAANIDGFRFDASSIARKVASQSESAQGDDGVVADEGSPYRESCASYHDWLQFLKQLQRIAEEVEEAERLKELERIKSALQEAQRLQQCMLEVITRERFDALVRQQHAENEAELRRERERERSQYMGFGREISRGRSR